MEQQEKMKLVENEQETSPQQEGIKRESLEDIQAQGREVIELTDIEGLEFSRYCSTATVIGYAGNDLDQSIQICQEDIKHIEHRLQFERQRLEILEKNRGKINDALESHMGKVSECFNKVALRLGREVTDFDTFGVFLDDNENVTHIVETPKGNTEES